MSGLESTHHSLQLPAVRAFAGQMTCLLGASGCGKSTMLNLLAGVLAAPPQRIYVLGTDLGTLTAAELGAWRAQNLGFIPQTALLVSSLNVAQNISVAQWGGVVNEAMRQSPAQAILDTLELSERLGDNPAHLSRGQQQRVAIARALIKAPALLLADEPTANLDDANAIKVMDLIAAHVARSGAVCVIASHDARVLPYCQHVVKFETAQSQDQTQTQTQAQAQSQTLSPAQPPVYRVVPNHA